MMISAQSQPSHTRPNPLLFVNEVANFSLNSSFVRYGGKSSLLKHVMDVGSLLGVSAN
eukprot:m.38057 g.38057  ORF g.38057 m.38057 type:complete len:58 (-) comp6776_c0_seq1:2290-2463(-)